MPNGAGPLHGTLHAPRSEGKVPSDRRGLAAFVAGSESASLPQPHDSGDGSVARTAHSTMNTPATTVHLRHLTPDRQPATPVDSALDQAVARTVRAGSAALGRLPAPVRYRAAGAIEAWSAARHAAGASGRRLTALLADPQQPPVPLLNDLGEFVQQHSTLDFDTPAGHAIAGLCSHSVYWQAFWERGGALYEPTPALDRLLDATDIAENIPMRLVQPPLPAMCILPDAATRSRLGGVEAVGVFTHADQTSANAGRCITFVVLSRMPEPQPGTRIEVMTFSSETDDRPIGESVELALRNPPLFGDANQPEEHLPRWRATLNYVVKMTLYLSLDTKQVVHERPYTTAPRTFPGLGKRKREERLALVETLYDRYVVGPTLLSADLASGSDGDSQHGVSAHWRRGHFRLQPHGPHNSLRKLMFIAPTLVHANQFLDIDP
jgi:hypothetical protein